MSGNLLYQFYSFVSYIGGNTIKLISSLGKVSIFVFLILRNILSFPSYFNILVRQFVVVGYFSLPIIAMTALFSGAVLALQSYTGFSRFSAESSIATVVVLSITRELGPVLAGLMVAGRVGASIAAEIATMHITEQIDALRTLSTDPIKYLVVPRVIACTIALPLLVLIADILGVMGGYLVSIYKLGFSSTPYLLNSLKYLELNDVISGLIKAGVFGFIISIVSCYYGYNSDRGAKGVGSATTGAVVCASVCILISNYFITDLVFN